MRKSSEESAQRCPGDWLYQPQHLALTGLSSRAVHAAGLAVIAHRSQQSSRPRCAAPTHPPSQLSACSTVLVRIMAAPLQYLAYGRWRCLSARLLAYPPPPPPRAPPPCTGCCPLQLLSLLAWALRSTCRLLLSLLLLVSHADCLLPARDACLTISLPMFYAIGVYLQRLRFHVWPSLQRPRPPLCTHRLGRLCTDLMYVVGRTA